VGVVERLGSPRRAHPVDLDDHESKLGQRLRITTCRREAAATDASCLRARIDVIDDRVFPAPIQTSGDVHQSVEIRLAIARLYGDGQRWFPAGGGETRDVRGLERDETLSSEISHHRYGRNFGSRVGIEEVLTRR